MACRPSQLDAESKNERNESVRGLQVVGIGRPKTLQILPLLSDSGRQQEAAGAHGKKNRPRRARILEVSAARECQQRGIQGVSDPAIRSNRNQGGRVFKWQIGASIGS